MTISRLLDTSSRRTVREPLDSYSSQHGASPYPHVPVGEQLRSTPRNTGDPVRRSAQMVAQLLVFALSPKGKISIQFTHRLRCLVGDRRTEMDEELPFAILRSSRLKPLAKKIELFVRVSPVPKIVLAIDDFRLLRMEFQSASLQPLRDGALYLLS